MTPDNPQDPQKGKVDEAAVPEDAKEAKVEAANQNKLIMIDVFSPT